MRIVVPNSLFRPSTREQVLTPSPITVYSSRLREPMLPTMTVSVWMPIPMAIGAWPTIVRSPLILASRAVMRSPARTARRSCPSPSSSAPKKASMPSPMNLSSTPCWSKTASTISENDLLGRHRLRHAREVADVGEQQGDAAALAAERDLLVQQLLGDLRGDVAAEDLLDPIAILEALHHLVQGGAQVADLVLPADRGADGEVTAADLLHGLEQVLQGPGDRARDQP